MTFHGLIVPLPTIFDARGEVDAAATAAFARGVQEGGADRLFPLGSLGEFASLTRDERRAVISGIVEVSGARRSVWVGTGAPSTREAVALATEAERAGASALVVVPPYYLHPTDLSIDRYYREIHASVEIPIYAYNIPSLVGYPLDPALVGRLAQDGVLSGIKDTSESLPSLRGFLGCGPSGFEVVPGDDVLAAPAIGLGAAGAVMGLANVLPRLAAALVAAAHRGDASATERLHELVEGLAFVVAGGPFPSAGKFLAAHLRGAPAGYRSPYDALTPAEERRVLDRWSVWEARLREFR